MRCPKCRVPMVEREGKGHYGAKLAFFQCPECSGFWVDGNVVAALSSDSAISAEPDIEFGDLRTEPRNEPAFCPRCEIQLIEQTGGGMPKGLRVDFCTGCNGFWFDKGELMLYESFLEKKRRQFRKSEEERRTRKKQVEQMPATASELVLKFLNTNVQKGFF